MFRCGIKSLKSILMKHLKIISLAFIVLSTSFSCSKDDSNEPEEDIQQLVKNFVTPNLIASLKQLGYNFNDGNEQPDISGTFYYSKHILVASNVEDDSAAGTEFTTSTFTFSNLNPQKRTFSFTGTDGSGSSFGDVTDTFYSGKGKDFSAYVKFSVTTKGETVIILLAVSGTISEKGITNAQDAVLMLDNKGNPSGAYIPNGKGRLFKDEDGTAVRQ